MNRRIVVKDIRLVVAHLLETEKTLRTFIPMSLMLGLFCNLNLGKRLLAARRCSAWGSLVWGVWLSKFEIHDNVNDAIRN